MTTRFAIDRLNMMRTSLLPISTKVDDVDIWRIGLDCDCSVVNSSYQILSLDEKQRAARFRFTKDRDRFVIARSNLRRIIGGYLSLEPVQIRFSCNEYGKPFVENTESPIRFNVSHSRDIALIAIAWGREVGIDIEFVDYELDIMTTANRIFSSTELSILETLTPDLRTPAFFRGWTRNEAYLKAIGKGFSGEAQQIPGTVLMDERRRVFNSIDGEGSRKLTLMSLTSDREFLAALAIEGEFGSIPKVQFPES